jgi:glucose/arabinose dehydrogenase
MYGILSSAAIFALIAATPAWAEVIKSEKAQLQVEIVADGLDHPWGLAFLPDGTMLVTERKGDLRSVTAAGEVSDPIGGVPEVDARGQGGLLDVAIDPDFERNRLVYMSFAEPGDGGNSTAVARGRLAEDAGGLTDVGIIFSQKPKVASTRHFGSRLVFDGNGHLFVTLGERSDEQFREMAQTLDNHLGKIVRINHDGSVPDDNPFVGKQDALPEIWSYGHRNVQAAVFDRETGILWEIEHGPRGGDELNIAEPGKNYGWPVVSHGINYGGTPVGSGAKTAPGMVDPIHQWTPVIAPSGMTIYRGEQFDAWQGNILVGGLRSTALVRLELDGGKVVHEERLLESRGKRIRDVVEGPKGAIYLVTDESNGEIIRLTAQ